MFVITRFHPTRLSKVAGSTTQLLQQSTSSAADPIPGPSSNLKSFNEIPGPKTMNFMLDMMKMSRVDRKSKEFGRMYFEFPAEMWKQYGDIYKIEIPFKEPVLFVYRPDLIEKFLRASGSKPQRPGFLAMKIKRDLDAKNGGLQAKGLLATQGDEWWEFRRKVQQPMLKPRATHRYTPLLDEIAQTFIDNLVRPGLDPQTKETPDDFLYDLYKWALESVTLLALNTRLGCLDANLSKDSEQYQIIQATQSLLFNSRELDDGMSLWQMMPNLSKTYQNFSQDCDLFAKISQRHIHQSIARAKDNLDSEEDPPLLTLFAERGCDEDTAVAMAMDMMFAGIDTSSHTGSFALYMLAKHPHVQQKLYEEIKSLLPDTDSKLDNAKLEKMHYLRAVLKETLRLFPPATGNARIIDEPLELGGYYIDRRTLYVAPHVYMCRSERYFKDAWEFRPERWLRNHPMKEDVHPFTMLPFGHGPRMCIGRRFAEQEAKILICKMVQNFQIEWHREEDLGVVVELLVKPDGPVKLTLLNR